MAAGDNIWLSGISGAIGAFIGAGASILGGVLNAKHDDEKRREDRRAATEDKRLGEATSTLSQAFSLLHEIRFLNKTAGGPSAAEIADLSPVWDGVRARLFTVGVGYPDKETAETAMKLVGKLTELVAGLEASKSGGAGSDDSEIDESYRLIFELLNRVRTQEGLVGIFGDQMTAWRGEPAPQTGPGST